MELTSIYRNVPFAGLAFVLLLATPLAVSVIRPASHETLNEQRALAPRPEWRWDVETMQTYPQAFEAWHDDHFALRPFLIRTHNRLRLLGMNRNYGERVVIGRDNWFFFNAGQGLIDHYRSPTPLTQHDLEDRLRVFSQRQRWLADRGIRYLLVIVPDKHTIYPEQLPGNAKSVSGPTRLDRVVDFIGESGEVDVLDLRPTLHATKQAHRVYDITDTHWNQVGAYAAAAAIQERIARWFPEARLPGLDACAIQWESRPGGDLAIMLGLSDVLSERRAVVVPPQKPSARRTAENLIESVPPRESQTIPYAMETPRTELPRAVMFHDSFGTHLVPFLSEGYVRLAVYWQYLFDDRVVKHEQPDIVIDQVVERVLLDSVLPNALPVVAP